MKHSKLVAGFLLTFALSGSASLWAQSTFVYSNDNATGTNTVSSFSVGSNGALTMLGVPVSTGGVGTGGGLFVATRILASPLGSFLYVANGGSGNVSVFSIDPGTGNLTPVTGSPFATATPPGSPQDLLLAVTPDNKFLFAAEVTQKQITVFSIASNGALTIVDTPVSVLFNPAGMKVTPDGKFLAVALTDLSAGSAADEIAMFSIGSGGALTAVSGSPFSTAPDGPVNVDFNCGATTLFGFEENSSQSQVGVFDIAADGSLSQISGSPFLFSSGEGSDGGVLSPDGQTLFVSNQLSGTVTSLTVASSGALSLVAGSPFAAGVGSCTLSGTGSCPAGLAMNSAGTFLFASSISPETAAFSAAADGVLAAVMGSPFSTTQAGSFANSLAVSPPQTCGATANLNPASVAFGDQPLGSTSATQTVTLTNPNPVYALTLTSITLTGTNPTDFSLLSSGSCPYTGGTVTQSSSCTVDIAFAPSAVGSRSATVSVADNAVGSPQSISLTGTGTTEPVVSFSPTSLPAFANQAVGTTSAAQIITLSNKGATALTINSIGISGTNGSDFAQTNNCGGSVAAAGSCTIDVTFTPQGINARTGTLTITDNNDGVANSTQTFALTGTGLGATADLSVTSLTFTGQDVGTTSPASTVTVTNNGNASLTISGISITGTNGGDFAQTNNCGSSLAAAASCTVQVTFKPTATGTRSGTLTMSDNAVGSASQTVSLTGTGLGATATITGAPLIFSAQYVGATSGPSTVTVMNNGNASLAISSIAISGSNAGDFAIQSASTCSTTAPLAAGKNCTVQVTFKPTGTGTRSGTLTISDNAVGSASQTASLTGTVKDFSLAVSGANSISAGQSATYTLTVTPLNGFSDTLQVSCAEQSSLTLSTCTASPSSVTLNGSAASTVTVTVSTTAEESRIPPRVRFWSHWSGPWRGHPGLLLGLWLVLLLGTLAALGLRQQAPAQRRRFARLATAWGTIALVATLWAACGGGGGSSQSTPPPAPAVSFSPGSLTFASQNVNTTSAAQPVTLTNTGNASLTISSIAATGDFAQTGTCGASLAAGANCQINVTFKPTTNGQRTGSVSVTDNATGSPQAVSLTGTGVKPGTPAGSYSITLTVTGGGVTHTSTASLTVH
ncbi:MAG TPA: choice-of-anchor D domain-containing protein [Terriglobia bacterium]|nr:choice-of-anchor D domain-containing protein [Terriglobia bacterium]